MTLRRAHGTAARGGRLLMVETLPADELPPASGSDPARGDRDASGRFAPGNRIARQAKVRCGARGELLQLYSKGTPAWQAANRWGRQYAAHRLTELAQAHGGEVSAEVSMMIQDAADATSDARWARASAAEAEADGDRETAARLRSEARQLRIEARGHRLAAWELAAREAAARPRRPQDVPWLISTPAPKAPASMPHAPQESLSSATPAATTTDQAGPSQGRLAPSDGEPQS